MTNAILITGGGGVGKTTIAAALGVAAAEAGHRTLVLTVDPARRLASALGLEELTNQPHPNPKQQGLYAAMLDSEIRLSWRLSAATASSSEVRTKYADCSGCNWPTADMSVDITTPIRA